MSRVGVQLGGAALCILTAIGIAAQTDEPVVTVAQGQVRGSRDADSHVLSFKGLPFAAPPVGQLRWRAPEPPKAWKGTRDATTFAASCMQSVHAGDVLPWTREFLVENQTSEDCLYLNVWTARAAASAKLPVIVFIHGGGFVEGSGAVRIYNGANLASTGAVVVTINYRLGVFGFFAHPELTAESPHHASGNYALMDQIAALRWVRDNITQFGGDPNRVTIWGQSAGAFSVGALIASPEAAGLFQRAQADSGLSEGGLPTPPLSAAEQAGSWFADSVRAAGLKELRAMPAEALLKAAGPGMRFMPDVDGWILPAAPNQLNASGHHNDVAVVTGNQANDYLLNGARIHTVAEYTAFAQQAYGANSANFLKLYPAAADGDVPQTFAESARDRERVGTFLWASARTRSHKSPVYTYFWTQAIPWPEHPQFQAFHTGEMPYLFRNLQMLDRPWQPADHTVSNMASDYLLSFASTGNPNSAGLPHWPAVAPARPVTMRLDLHPSSIPVADGSRYQFWVRYFDSLNGRPTSPF